MLPFEPLVKNPHLQTIFANSWPRRYDESSWPIESRLVQTDACTKVLVQTQSPTGAPRGEVVLLHGLEGSGAAGYMRSMAYDTLQRGYIAHRFHMRTCGGTARHTNTLYHAGLTSDVQVWLEQIRSERRMLPVFLIGFSLGGNIALKLAGELGETDLIHGVCTFSTPIDLAAGVRRIMRHDNFLYEHRLVRAMRARMHATGRYSRGELAGRKSIYELDDEITAPSFGFKNADHYYATQSATNYLDRIRVPALVVQSRDDTFIPFESYNHPAFQSNPNLRLAATDYGGHLGFISRRSPRFWMDEVAIEFMNGVSSDLRGRRERAGRRLAR